MAISSPTFCTATIWGDPIAKGRPRMGPSGHAYTPERTRAAERAVAAALAAAMEGVPICDMPLGLDVRFFCATARRTDGDNLLKLVTDGANAIVMTDDHLVHEWHVRLTRGVGKKDARTEISFYILDGE